MRANSVATSHAHASESIVGASSGVPPPVVGAPPGVPPPVVGAPPTGRSESFGGGGRPRTLSGRSRTESFEVEGVDLRPNAAYASMSDLGAALPTGSPSSRSAAPLPYGTSPPRGRPMPGPLTPPPVSALHRHGSVDLPPGGQRYRAGSVVGRTNEDTPLARARKGLSPKRCLTLDRYTAEWRPVTPFLLPCIALHLNWQPVTSVSLLSIILMRHGNHYVYCPFVPT